MESVFQKLKVDHACFSIFLIRIFVKKKLWRINCSPADVKAGIRTQPFRFICFEAKL